LQGIAGYHRAVSIRRPAATQKQLAKLLDLRNEHPERLADIDAQIRARFEVERAILVLDMCGFSRLTLRHGIIHYLSMIRRMQRVVVPLVEARGGSVVKTEADNLFATFNTVPRALLTAQSVQTALARVNAALPEDWDVHVGVGIGFGPLLCLGHDVFGSEMNLASKLGEDLAKGGDILLTEAAQKRAGARARRYQTRRTRVGGMRLTYYAAPRTPGA
jgi:adenylate cyclase